MLCFRWQVIGISNHSVFNDFVPLLFLSLDTPDTQLPHQDVWAKNFPYFSHLIFCQLALWACGMLPEVNPVHNDKFERDTLKERNSRRVSTNFMAIASWWVLLWGRSLLLNGCIYEDLKDLLGKHHRIWEAACPPMYASMVWLIDSPLNASISQTSIINILRNVYSLVRNQWQWSVLKTCIII